MTWETSMRFSGKMWLMIILKTTKKKKKSFTFSLKGTFFGKPQGRSNWPPVILELMFVRLTLVFMWNSAIQEKRE